MISNSFFKHLLVRAGKHSNFNNKIVVNFTSNRALSYITIIYFLLVKL